MSYPKNPLRDRIIAHGYSGLQAKEFPGTEICAGSVSRLLGRYGFKKFYLRQDEIDLLMKLRKEKGLI